MYLYYKIYLHVLKRRLHVSTWSALLRSPGDLLFLALVFLLALLFFGIFLLLLKIYRAQKVRKNVFFKGLFDYLHNEGDDTMNNFFDKGRAHVSVNMAQTPLAENENLLVSIIAGIDQVQDKQALEYLHLNFAARLQAQGEVFAGNTDNYLAMLRTELKGEQSAFNEKMLKYLEQNPEVLAALMNKQNPSTEPAPTSEEVSTVMAPDATSELAPASEEVAADLAPEPAPAGEEASTENIVGLSLVQSPEVFPHEEELKSLLRSIKWNLVNPKIPDEGDYSLEDVLHLKLDCVLRQFRERTIKDRNEKRAGELLREYKEFIEGGKLAQKVGWNILASKKSCWKMQLFFIFLNLYVIINLNIV